MIARDIAIDLGTATTSIVSRGDGLICSEPSVVARAVETGEVVAVGSEAAQMMGRTPEGLQATRPLRGGAITDFDSAEAMIRTFLHRVGVRRLNRPRVVVCVPSSITAVERRAVREAAQRAGAAEVQLLGYTMAAALGCGLPLDQPQGSMVVDIGAGTTEAAVVSLGGVVASEFRRSGGLDLDLDIRGYVERRHGLRTSLASAERVKHALATATPAVQPSSAEETVQVRGRHVRTGAVQAVTLTATEVTDAVYDKVMEMVDAVVACLGWAPPEIANDLIENGIHLVGGGSLLDGMAARISHDTKVPVRVVDDPQRVVVTGAGRCLGLFSELEGFFLSDYLPSPVHS